MRRKLRAKEFSSDDVDSVIERLRREKWIDDERFAGAFTRTRARRHIGKLRIKRELGSAGVNNEAIARAVRENIDPEVEREAAKALALKKWNVLRRRNDEDAARKKVAAFLQRQGYELSLVLEVLRGLK